MHRCRGNLWVDGWAPWAELGLIGQEITHRRRPPAGGGADRPLPRHGANPETGLHDADTMACA